MLTKYTQNELSAFLFSANQKFDELSNLTKNLCDNKSKQTTLDLIFRTSADLKTIITSFTDQEIADLIKAKFDEPINANLQSTEVITSNIIDDICKKLLEIKNYLNLKFKAVETLDNPNNKIITNIPSSMGESTEQYQSLLMAVGQMSIWSFHDVINYLAKIQGYSEMLEDIYNIMGENPDSKTLLESRSELSSIMTKLSENIGEILSTINRIRAVRGKVFHENADYNLRDMVDKLIKSTIFAKFNVSWSNSMIPDFIIHVDNMIFEQTWLYLWRMLAEWLTPNVPAKANILSRIQVGGKNLNNNYPDKVLLYIWMQPNNIPQTRFLPEKLMFSSEPPLPDLGNVLKVTRAIANKTGMEISYSKTPDGCPLFLLSVEGGLNVVKFGSDLKISMDPEKQKIVEQAKEEILATKKDDSKDKYSILIVDDEQDILSLLSTKIGKLGYTIYSANSLTEAKDIIQTKSISLVLADLFLSQESGLDLFRDVKTNNPNIHFVFMSGANEDDVSSAVLQVLTRYASAFLRKPISTSQLKETLESFLK